MPYKGETASKTSQATTLRDAAVAAALGRYRVTGAELSDPASIAGLTKPLDELSVTTELADVHSCLSLDGSRQETPVGTQGNVQLSVGFVRVAVASVNLDLQRVVNKDKFVNQGKLARVQSANVLSYALPGVGLSTTAPDGRLLGAAASWRFACDAMLHECGTEGVTLADALILINTPAGGDPEKTLIPVKNCPSCAAFATGPGQVGTVGRDGGACTSCGDELLLADHLGVDDLLATYGRENSLNLVMDFTERLALVATIEALRQQGLAKLAATAVVVDGPLSALRTSEKLVKPILSYLEAVSAELEAAGLGPLLLIGVEKTGQFVEHAAVVADLIPEGHAMKLPTDYISTHVTGRTSERGTYGSRHMYGRRFFYRRRDGHMLVVTVPARAGVAPWSQSATSEQWDSYPGLATMLGLLEELSSSQFPGAVIPLILAHEQSSLPLTASDALARLSQDALDLTQNTRLRLRNPWD